MKLSQLIWIPSTAALYLCIFLPGQISAQARLLGSLPARINSNMYSTTFLFCKVFCINTSSSCPNTSIAFRLVNALIFFKSNVSCLFLSASSGGYPMPNPSVNSFSMVRCKLISPAKIYHFMAIWFYCQRRIMVQQFIFIFLGRCLNHTYFHKLKPLLHHFSH